MKNTTLATLGAAILWSASVIIQEAHPNDHHISLSQQHSCAFDPDVHRMIVVDNDDDCDDSDPTWMPVPSTGDMFDTNDRGFAIEFLQPRSAGALFTDDCDDGDPSWMPAPPFSALVTIGPTGGHAWELRDAIQSKIRDIVEQDTRASTYFPDETLTLDVAEGGRFRQEMQEILKQLSQENTFVNRALIDGHLPYILLRPRGNGS